VSIRRSASRMAVTSALVTIAVLLLSGTAQAATTVALWNMGDTGSTMYDATGRGHTGTLHNVSVQQPGQAGKAYRFAGTPSYVTVPASADFTPGTGAFRIQLSVNFTARPSPSVVDYDLIRRGLSTTAGGDYKVEILQSGKAYCEFRGSGGVGAVSGGPALSDGRWHVISCARTTSSVILTVDGISYSTAKATGSITNSVPLYIGAKDGGGADQYAGLMDTVSISKG
jgi:Concanavalin A-like lectin/glucanases superfamily